MAARPVGYRMMRLANPEIRMEPTNHCNAHCVMCPREKMTRARGCMDMALFRSILRQAVELGATKVSLENYGEPLLDGHLFERAAFAKSLGLETLTITNGSLLTDAACQQALKCFDVIRISLCGMTADTYAKVHRGLDFDVVTGNIGKLLAMKRERGSGTRIILTFVMLWDNADDARAFLDKYEPLVDGVAVWKPHNWSYGRQYRNVSGQRRTCGRPHTGPVQVQWDGKVVPCCFDYDSRMILGDLTCQSLADVISGPEYEHLREVHRKGDFVEPCASCDQLHKDDGSLVYTNIDRLEVGTTSTGLFKL